jgi:hypothetical protein
MNRDGISNNSKKLLKNIIYNKTWKKRRDDMEKLIVTRHPGLVQFLKEEYGIEGEVVTHASPEIVRGRDVIGVLPHSLSCLTKSFSEVPLRFTPEMRGKELTKEEVMEIASPMVTYSVRRI